MKLGPTVLAAIVASVRKGLSEGLDVSQLLRDLDVEIDPNGREIRVTPPPGSTTDV